MIAGALSVRVVPMRSTDDLRAIYPRHLELDREFKGDRNRTMRPYMLASAPAQRAFELMEPIAKTGRVCFGASLGGELEGTALFALDAAGVDEARELLAIADPEGELEWTLSPWYATRAVEQLGAKSPKP